MRKIRTDLEKLRKPAEPLTFLTNEGPQTEEGKKIISDIKKVMEKDENLLALSAPQLGIEKRIFCLRFNDQIKTFINPILPSSSISETRPSSSGITPSKICACWSNRLAATPTNLLSSYLNSSL